MNSFCKSLEIILVNKKIIKTICQGMDFSCIFISTLE